MITITIYQDKDKNYKRLCCSGHAGYSEYGTDIVCAAVSTLVISTLNSLEAFTDTKYSDEKYDEVAGLIDVTFKGELSHDATLLLNSLSLGLRNIINDNTSDYIRLFFKEV